MPAHEHVKKSPSRLKSGPQRRPREGGDPYKSLFQLDKWIPAFAGMTLAAYLRTGHFDFFTCSFAGMTAGGSSSIEDAPKWCLPKSFSSFFTRNPRGRESKVAFKVSFMLPDGEA
jgi:hypothetical protein